MKRLIVLLLAMAMLFVSNVYAASTLTELYSNMRISTTPYDEYLSVYSGATVADGATTMFTLPMKYDNGHITYCRVTVGSSSDAIVWLSGEDNYSVDGPYTFVHGTTIDGSYTFPITTPLPYFNTEDPQARQLTLSLTNNSGVETGTWYVIIVVKEK